jgi:hypothetical protein
VNLSVTFIIILATVAMYEKDIPEHKAQVKKAYTYNNINNPHPETEEIERTVRSHIGWAVNNKDRKTLYSTVIENEELFYFSPDSKGTVSGIDEFTYLVDNLFMLDDFKAIRTEINDLRIHISPTLNTAWFSCILNDYNEFRGEPAVWENVRWTGVLEKVDGKWRIFQMHFSKAEDQI